MVLNNNINSITTNSGKRRNSKRTRRLTRKRRNWRLIRCISPFADFLFQLTSSEKPKKAVYPPLATMVPKKRSGRSRLRVWEGERREEGEEGVWLETVDGAT